mgnify:CR=1 FL=1
MSDPEQLAGYDEAATNPTADLQAIEIEVAGIGKAPSSR